MLWYAVGGHGGRAGSPQLRHRRCQRLARGLDNINAAFERALGPAWTVVLAVFVFLVLALVSVSKLAVSPGGASVQRDKFVVIMDGLLLMVLMELLVAYTIVYFLDDRDREALRNLTLLVPNDLAERRDRRHRWALVATVAVVVATVALVVVHSGGDLVRYVRS